MLNKIEWIEDTGLSLACRLMDETGHIYDTTTGTCVAEPVTPNLSFAENANMPGFYSVSMPTGLLSTDQQYTIVIYDLDDSSPVPLAGGTLEVKFGILQTKISSRERI